MQTRILQTNYSLILLFALIGTLPIGGVNTVSVSNDTLLPYQEVIDTLILDDTSININIPIDTTTLSSSTKEPEIKLDSAMLKKIDNILTLHAKQKNEYSTPARLDKTLQRLLPKSNIEFSKELLYWINWRRGENTGITNQTYKDTAIVDPMFLSYILKAKVLPKDPLPHYKLYEEKKNGAYSTIYPNDTTFLRAEFTKQAIRDSAYRYLETYSPGIIRYTANDFNTGKVETKIFEKKTTPEEGLKRAKSYTLEQVKMNKFAPKRRYWTTTMNSSFQFSQSYISPNWHRGGVGTTQLYSRQYFTFNYARDKISLFNEIEWTIGFFKTPNDSLRSFNFNNDNLRIRYLLGHQAFGNWKYTIDATLQTPLFTKYQENTTTKSSGFLAAYKLNIGIGMTYSFAKTFTSGRNINISITMSPLSFEQQGSIVKAILAEKINTIGSDIQMNFSSTIFKNVTIQSWFHYNTNYHKVFAEMNNTINFTINRFLSTTLTANFRFDDTVAKREDFKTHLQINELLSIGFNYKW